MKKKQIANSYVLKRIHKLTTTTLKEEQTLCYKMNLQNSIVQPLYEVERCLTN